MHISKIIIRNNLNHVDYIGGNVEDSHVPLCSVVVSVLNGSLWITTDRRVCTFSRDNVNYSYAELTREDALSCRLARIHLYLRGRTKLC